MFSVAVLFLNHGSVGITVCELFHARFSYVPSHNSYSHSDSIDMTVCEYILPYIGVTVLIGHITLWSCGLNRG